MPVGFGWPYCHRSTDFAVGYPSQNAMNTPEAPILPETGICWSTEADCAEPPYTVTDPGTRVFSPAEGETVSANIPSALSAFENHPITTSPVAESVARPAL